MNDRKFISILIALNENQKTFLKKKLNEKCKEKYDSILSGFIKNKVYRDNVIQILRENYNEFIKPYLNIETIKYTPNKIEKIAIIVANESYQLVSHRINEYDKYKYLYDESSLYIAVYQYKTLVTNNIIIAFRGTKQINDVIPDYFILRNKHNLSQRFKKSLEIFDQIKTKYPSANIYVCGHSLGGTLAIWIKQNRESCKQCYAFNPGYNGYLIPKLNLQNDHLKIFLIKGDPLSNTIFALKDNMKPQKNNLIILQGNENSPLQNHAMKNFINLV